MSGSLHSFLSVVYYFLPYADARHQPRQSSRVVHLVPHPRSSSYSQQGEPLTKEEEEDSDNEEDGMEAEMT